MLHELLLVFRHTLTGVNRACVDWKGACGGYKMSMISQIPAGKGKGELKFCRAGLSQNYYP